MRSLLSGSAETKAKELGATRPYVRGIAWVWSTGFPTEAKAKEFVAWLEANCYEHRGVYKVDSLGYNVRWR